MVLYTDGLIETRNKSEELLGDDRFAALIREHATDSPELCADRIIEQIMKWSGRSAGKSLDNDLTLLVVDVVVGRETSTVEAKAERG